MLKNIALSLFLCTFLGAENFDIFLQRAIKNSPYLNAQALEIERSRVRSELFTRYENPALELEYSRFLPSGAKNESGYRIGYVQPVRLWGVQEAKENLANAEIKSSIKEYEQKKALFIRDISLSYVLYAQQKMLFELSQEELLIARKMYDIAKIRYDNGTVSRIVAMQALLAQKKALVANESLSLSLAQTYYDMLQAAGINEDIVIDPEHDFKPIQKNRQSPNLAFMNTEIERSVLEAGVYSHKVEGIDLVVEYEKEDDQNIARIGVNIPLAVLNQRSQERRAALLRAEESKLLFENQSSYNDTEIRRLTSERSSLQKLKAKNEDMLNTELELSAMLEESYDISNVNLLRLYEMKDRVVSTKKELIHVKSALNQNTIKLNYLRGGYNE